MLAALALAAAALPPASEAARTKVERGMNLFSAEQDVELGREAAAEAEKTLTILADPRLTSYVSDLGLRVAKVSAEPGFPYQFKIIDSSEINAFALPGGFIYVNRGVLEAASDEAELAGVLAHEVGHVVARHGTNQASKQMLVQMPLAILMGGVVKDDSGWKGTLAKMGVGLGLNAVFLSYSRKAETQADLLATQELYDAGYDPAGTARFFEKLKAKQKSEPSKLDKFFASHPDPGDRAVRVEQEVKLLGPRSSPALTSSREFDRMKARLGELPPPRTRSDAPQGGTRQGGAGGQGEDPRDGADAATEGHPRVPVPSGRFIRYTDPGDSFRAVVPREWKAEAARDGSVTIAPEEARVDGTLTHAFLVRPLDLRIGTRRGAFDAAMDRLVDDLLAESKYLRERRGARRPAALDGEEAIETTLEGRARGKSHDYDEVVVVTLRPLGRGSVAVLRVFPAADARAWAPVFAEMVESMRFY